MISFSNNLNKIFLRWSDLKLVVVANSLQLFYNTSDNGYYTIWTISDNDIYTTVIWTHDVPWAIAQNGYTQEQNDADKLDWETNFLPTANNIAS